MTPPRKKKDTAAALAEMFPHIANVLYRLTHGMSCPAELTVPQFKTLQFIHSSGRDLKMSELSKLLGVAGSTLTETVKKLAADGYLSRVRSPSDDRVVLLSLTPKSKKIMAEHAANFERFFRMVCQHAGAEGSKKLLSAHEYILATYMKVLAEQGGDKEK